MRFDFFEEKPLAFRLLNWSFAAVFLVACTPQMPDSYKETLVPAEIEGEPPREKYYYSNWFGQASLLHARESPLER